MTWQAASFVLLAVAVAAGFAWYERDRPPSRVLALVAALAALAVVGRLAFAAVPNVKPTTDIVLFAGFALGALPGFAVGAVTAIVSNIFLSQGPWTVWQMAGWGAVGVGGALLARILRGREPSRLVLAAACGLAGLAFGAWMDVYQWTLGARQDLDSYLVVAASSLPYNLAHAIGNVVFCLLIGPAFVRALERYRRRLEVRWPAPAGAAAGCRAACRDDRGLRSAAAGARRLDRRQGRALPAARAERRRRLRRRAGSELVAALHGLDRARPGGGGPQPGRRRAARGELDRGLREAGARARGHRRGGADGAAPAQRRDRSAALRRPQPAGGDRAPPPARRLDRRLRELHGLRHPRAARVGGARRRRDGRLARAQPERGRRLRGCHLLGQRRRHDRRRASGARRRAPWPRRGGPPGRGLAPLGSERRRRLRADAGSQLERAVDRVRGAGAGGGWGAPAGGRPGARLPARPGAAGREHRLLANELADAGLGDRPGAHGAAPHGVADRGGCARAASAPFGQARSGGRREPSRPRVADRRRRARQRRARREPRRARAERTLKAARRTPGAPAPARGVGIAVARPGGRGLRGAALPPGPRGPRAPGRAPARPTALSASHRGGCSWSGGAAVSW